MNPWIIYAIACYAFMAIAIPVYLRTSIRWHEKYRQWECCIPDAEEVKEPPVWIAPVDGDIVDKFTFGIWFVLAPITTIVCFSMLLVYLLGSLFLSWGKK